MSLSDRIGSYDDETLSYQLSVKDVKEAVKELFLKVFRSEYDENVNVWYQRGWDDNSKRFSKIIKEIFGEELVE